MACHWARPPIRRRGFYAKPAPKARIGVAQVEDLLQAAVGAEKWSFNTKRTKNTKRAKNAKRAKDVSAPSARE
jgi:hypothetical protein